MSFTQGDFVRLDGAFKTAAGVPLDPTTVAITIVQPDGQRNTYTYVTDVEVVKDSVGNYHINRNASIPGTWVYWWHSGGTGQAAVEKTFIVEASRAADPPGDPASLQINFSQITREVGRLLGLSPDNNGWGDRERQDVRDIMRSGVRRFYWSPVLPNADGKGATVYSWSFLRGVKTLPLVASQSTYALPDDFGEMLQGGFTHAAGSGRTPIGLIGEEQMRQLQAVPSDTATPKYASIQRLPGTPLKYQVNFYPTPNEAITLSFNYAITPPELSEASPYPYGGAQHSEAILEAILAAAEQKLQDQEGLHEKRFLECLARSIAADRNLSSQSDDSPWPLDSSTGLAQGLGVTKAYLKRLIGRELDFGPHPSLWTHRQAEEVNVVLDTGLRKLYSPMVLPGERFGWEWSFLKPVYTLSTVAGVSVYDLPEDLALLEGPLTHAPTAAALYPSIPLVGESQLRYRQQQSTATGRPCYAATRVKTPNPSGGTRWELLLWPTPDGAYDLTFRYQVNPAAMPDDACLPHGGPPHAQTVIEACLSAAEDYQGVKNGVHGTLFLENLIRSVGHDRKANSPASLGLNRDGSDLVYDRNYHLLNETLHRYNGILH